MPKVAVAPHAVVAALCERLTRERLFDLIVVINDVENALLSAMRTGHTLRLERKFSAADGAAIAQNAFHIFFMLRTVTLHFYDSVYGAKSTEKIFFKIKFFCTKYF